MLSLLELHRFRVKYGSSYERFMQQWPEYHHISKRQFVCKLEKIRVAKHANKIRQDPLYSCQPAFPACYFPPVPDADTVPELAPAHADSPEPTTAPEESPEPVPEEAPGPTPALEESTEPTPALEESTEPTPALEESTEPTPALEESTEPTPALEESTEPTAAPEEISGTLQEEHSTSTPLHFPPLYIESGCQTDDISVAERCSMTEQQFLHFPLPKKYLRSKSVQVNIKPLFRSIKSQANFRSGAEYYAPCCVASVSLPETKAALHRMSELYDSLVVEMKQLMTYQIKKHLSKVIILEKEIESLKNKNCILSSQIEQQSEVRHLDPVEECVIGPDVVPPLADDVQLTVNQYCDNLYEMITQKGLKQRPHQIVENQSEDNSTQADAGPPQWCTSPATSSMSPSSDDEKPNLQEERSPPLHSAHQRRAGRVYEEIFQSVEAKPPLQPECLALGGLINQLPCTEAAQNNSSPMQPVKAEHDACTNILGYQFEASHVVGPPSQQQQQPPSGVMAPRQRCSVKRKIGATSDLASSGALRLNEIYGASTDGASTDGASTDGTLTKLQKML